MDVNMTVFQPILILAAFLCSLVAGFLFAFAAVVMPGIRRLDDGAFIRAFQVIDGVIQNNQPMFLIVWVGSMPVLLAAAVVGVWALNGADREAAGDHRWDGWSDKPVVFRSWCDDNSAVETNLPLGRDRDRLNL